MKNKYNTWKNNWNPKTSSIVPKPQIDFLNKQNFAHMRYDIKKLTIKYYTKPVYMKLR